ncbi:MAG: 2-keto-4-pentenoate hydratase [Acidimicrobiales bacterium]
MDQTGMDATETARIAAAADRLLDQRRTGRVEPGLAPALAPADLAGAYAVQERVVDGLLAGGGRRIGYKVACTNAIAQEALQIASPLHGQLLSVSTSPSGAVLPAARFTHRVVEAEFAFRVGADVAAVPGGHTAATVAPFLDQVLPGIEIVDYRFASWTVGALQVAADNAIHGWWVRGEPYAGPFAELDLAAHEVVVRRNGEAATTGTGAAVLGGPLNVMAWLADELLRFGGGLRAGDYVTTGVCTDVFEAEAGDHLEADFGVLGRVELTFR